MLHKAILVASDKVLLKNHSTCTDKHFQVSALEPCEHYLSHLKSKTRNRNIQSASCSICQIWKTTEEPKSIEANDLVKDV